MDLINDVFIPVYQRIVEKKEDLVGKQEKRTHGFEPSWFTPQVVIALENAGLDPVPHGVGVDITFSDGSILELKAATDFRLNYLIKEGALRYNAPVLFLCNGTNKNKINELKERPEVRVLHYDYLNDGKDDWILGLIEPN